MIRKMAGLFGAFALCAVGGVVLAGNDFEISWYTIDGGGGKSTSADGHIELQGTIGQPDAGVMTGGNFELTGGFWFRLEPGDCNSDGGVNSFDYHSFGGCMGGPNGISLTDNCKCFDSDGDGDLDLIDFANFQVNFAE